MFSLLQDIIDPHFGQFTTFPSSLDDSKDVLSPKAIGELNIFLHSGQTISVFGISFPPNYV